MNALIGMPAGTRVWLAAGVTDLRKGFDGLAALVQSQLAENAFSGHVFVFRGRFVWPQATNGVVHLTTAQLSMLLEGIDWRRPERTWQPTLAA